jgi:DNA mismatch repair ATPase MutL
MSPRRSSRARTTQPNHPSVPTAPSVSSSSVSSARTDRATRTDYKQSSPHKSLTPHSLSSEEPEEPDEPPRGSQMERPLTRRRTREQDLDETESAKLDDELDDDMAEEDEVTRCVCGYQEYPGPPSDTTKSLNDADTQGDDLGGLFIQCDVCKVWQHGGCVGIMDEAASPEEYFCEECRKDLHKVTASPKGCVNVLPCVSHHSLRRIAPCAD